MLRLTTRQVYTDLTMNKNRNNFITSVLIKVSSNLTNSIRRV
jgi:hypothetical protein